MSDKATTEKKTDKERTVKKRAARSLVAPVKYKPTEGKPRQSLELTAPIGLTWNEDAVKPENKPKPMVGTGWPDRPPTPRVPQKPKFDSTPLSKPAPLSVEIPPAEERMIKPIVREEPVKKVVKKQVKKSEPVKKEEPVSEVKEAEKPKQDKPVKEPAVRQQAPKQQPPRQQPPRQQAPKQQPPRQQPPRQQAPKQQPPRQQASKQEPQRQQAPRVLHSPVNIHDEHVQISPMQKRPVSSTSTWEGPIQQYPGFPGEPGMGPKFVRTVVTTTTTTYEPVTEDVIRQITSQTSPVALPEQVLAQPAMAPVQQPMQQVQPPVRQPRRQPPQRQPQRQQAGPGQARPGQQRSGQARPQQTGRMNPQAVPPRQQTGQMNPPAVPPRQQTGQMNPQAMPPRQQQMGQQAPVNQPGSVNHGGSIIGAMEAKGSQAPAKPMSIKDRQLAEIEKALGLEGSNSVNSNPNLNDKPNVPGRPVIGDKPIPVGRPVPEMDKETKKSAEYMMLFVEGIIFIIVLAICISIFQKIKKANKPVDTSSETAYEQTQEPEEQQADQGDQGTEDFEVEQAGSGDEIGSETDILGESGSEGQTAPSGSVDVDNDDFVLKCTNVTVKLDTEGNPAALIYFSFTNKTSEQLALADVFPISVTQNGEPCDTFAALDEYPEEYYNKDMQISDGSELSCAYAVSLKDAVTPLVLTVNNNRDGFTEVGTTEIAIQ